MAGVGSLLKKKLDLGAMLAEHIRHVVTQAKTKWGKNGSIVHIRQRLDKLFPHYVSEQVCE